MCAFFIATATLQKTVQLVETYFHWASAQYKNNVQTDIIEGMI